MDLNPQPFNHESGALTTELSLPQYRCDVRGVCACELDGSWGGSLLSEVLRHGGLQLVITEVVPVGDGVGGKVNIL